MGILIALSAARCSTAKGTTRPHGSATVSDEDEWYRLIGNTLIVNKPGYLVNDSYRVDGSHWIFDGSKFSAVLERMPA